MIHVVVISLLLAADPGSDVLKVFSAKCSSCHGVDVIEPEGDPPFGYVDDLKRLAADKPRVSDLGKLVASGNMPPRDSESGTLSADEKVIVQKWISAGTPLPVISKPLEEQGSAQAPPAQSASSPNGRGLDEATPEVGTGATEQPVSAFHRTVKWAGKWHLLTLHFPIALIVAAAVRELWSMYRRSWEIDSEVRFILVSAAVSAIVAAVLGWIHAHNGAGGGSPNLVYHRWLGTAAAILVVYTAYRSEVDAGAGRRSTPTRVLIFTTSGLVAMAAHYGGKMIHGSNFMDW